MKTETVLVVIAVFLSGTLTANILNTPSPSEKPSHQYVDYNGEIIHYPYKIEFVDKIDNKTDVTGEALITEPDIGLKEIKIKVGRPAEEVIETCNHEVLHHYFPDFRHSEQPNPFKDPIYRLEDNVEFETCEYVVGEALVRQNS